MAGRGGRAGGSAQQEYERRRGKDQERRRRTRGRRVLLAVALVVGAYVLGRFGVPAVYDWAVRSFVPVDGGPDVPAFDHDRAHLLGVLLALAMAVSVLRTWSGRRQSTEAWAKGAEGERRTGRTLDRLPDGYRVFHDLAMAGTRANIDHIVVGPTGVFTVETKNYSRDVVVRGGQVTSAGRSLAGVVAQAQRQAAAIDTLLGCPVRAVVVVQGAGVQVSGWGSSPVVDGVRFCSGRRLAKVITRGPVVHDEAELARILPRLP